MSRRNGSLYLERIEFSNFRAYGESFSLDVPDGPGITLVHGPNGLGKTTLFDGIEWCLTGDISRFDRYLLGPASKRVQHLTRLGAPEGSHRVTLSFTGVEPIDRGRGFTPAPAQIARVLKRPEWPEVSDLARYLSITHFLGQSAAQRFSVKDPKDQWEALKGPAGIDRINHIKDRIGGNATRQAFTRYLRDAESALIVAQQALAGWKSLLDKLEQLGSLSLSADALPPAGVLELCAQAMRALSTFEVEADKAAELPHAPEAALEQLRLALEAARQHLSEDGARLEVLGTLAEELPAIRAEERASAELATAAERRRASASNELVKLDTGLERAALDLDRALQIKADAETRLKVVGLIGDSLTIFNESSARAVTIEVQIPEVAARIAQTDARCSELANTIAEVEQRNAQRHDLAERTSRLHSAIPVVRELESLSNWVSEQGDRDDAEQELSKLRERRLTLESQENAWKTGIATSETQLDAHDRREALIAAAVAEIASSLSAEDIDCPVCQTRFRPGELLHLIQSGREVPDTGVREVAEKLVFQRLELASVTTELLDLDVQIRTLNERVRERELAAGKVLELQSKVFELTSGLNIGSVDELQRLLSAAESDLAALVTAIDTSPSVDELRSEAKILDVARSAEMSRAERLRLELAEVLAEAGKARATLEQHPELWMEDGGLTVPLDELRSGAAERVVAAAIDVEKYEDAANTVRGQIETRRTEVAEAAAQRDVHRARQTELVLRQSDLIGTWLSLRMPDEPDAGAVWQERDRLAEAERGVRTVVELLERAHKQYRAWLGDEELAECQRQVREAMNQVGVDDEQEMNKVLSRAVTDAEVRIARAARARQKADEVAIDLKVRANTYAHNVLQPLNDTIQDFASTLLTGAEGSLLYRAEHHVNRSGLRPSIMRTDAFGQLQPLDMNPNLYFSEGQLSALSVSALLAASTTFRWSRWPALLMDDPLQHNDLIHASAFIDLLRRLVDQLGYQVILSSHDAAEADFIARKCRSVGIRYALCELIPAGESGIVSAS